MKTIFEITPNENDLDISSFKYQVELTKKLDNLNSDFNQETLNEIILWKVNRYAKFDEEIRRRFGPLPERAAAGEFDAWASQPRPALALVLSLDQFPRNLFRGSPQAFQAAVNALELLMITFRFPSRQRWTPAMKLSSLSGLVRAHSYSSLSACRSSSQ